MQMTPSQIKKETGDTHHCIGHCIDHARKVLGVGRSVVEYADMVASVGLEVGLERRVIVELVPLRWVC